MDHQKRQSHEGKRLLTVAEVAHALGVSGAYIRKLVATGAVPHIRLGRAIRFDPADIEAWIERRKRATGKAPRR